MALVVAAIAAEESWDELRDCQLISHAGNDADSFHVQHRDDHYIFRICFVDSPETSRAIPHRITEQALWWSVTEDDVLMHGKDATEFTQDFLKDGFTVQTQYKDARGQSAMKRNFAMIRVDGRYLSEALVENGWGRAYGYLPDLPDGSSRWTYREHLQALESRAKSDRKGVWSTSVLTATPNAMPGGEESEVPPGKTITLARPAALYSGGPSAHFLGTLKVGTDVLVLDQPPARMQRVRAPFHDRIVEGQCRVRDLGL
jgi:endonuclease YncB( thermonuclease family)